MSAIVFPQQASAGRFWKRYGEAVLLGVLVMAFGLTNVVTPRTETLVPSADGSPLNAALWLCLFAASLPIAIRQRDRLRCLVASAWPLIPLLGWCWLSIAWSIAPEIAFRRVVLETVVVAVVLTLAAQQSASAALVCALACFAVLLLAVDLLVTLCAPRLAFADGEWQGFHENKNVAGAAAMLALIVSLFGVLAGTGIARRLVFGAAAAGWSLLLLLSHSKTSAGVVPIAVAAGIWLDLGVRRGPRMLAAGVGVLAVALAAFLLPFAVRPSGRILGALVGDPTFTGRTYVWDFVARWIARSPLTGVGFGSFWQIGTGGPADTGGLWFVAVAGEGHNGYLDLAVTVGYVGLGLFLLLVTLCAVRLFQASAAAPADAERTALGGLLSLLAAALVHNLMESSFLRAGFPVWVLALFAMAHVFLLAKPGGPQ
jgi:O-antigen ligase